ncbi:hypothetical protein [Nonlabens sp.]|uniref:hypothetical protein n=1 Tax=Nonlabens sp. TaxID=1888209 RepID=UPI003F69BACC
MGTFIKVTYIIILLCTTTALGQATVATTAPIVNLNRSINFTPSYNAYKLHSISRSVLLTTNTLPLTQTAIQKNKINFSTLPVITTNSQFPTVYNSNKEPFLQFGNYDWEYQNMKVNNAAFYEATNNTILSSGYFDGGYCPPRL